jgi:hypothetical protein
MARGRSPMCRSSTPSIVRRRSRGSLPRLHLLDEPNQGHLFIRRDLPLLRLVEYGRAGFASRLGPPRQLPQGAAAAKEAAEAVCGKGLVEAGHPHKLAVKVWTSGRNPPDIKLFYQA